MLVIFIFFLLFIGGKYNLDSYIKKPIITILTPVLEYTSNIIFKTRDVMYSLVNFYKFSRENIQLRKKIKNLETRVNENEVLRFENDRLNQLLNFKSRLNFDVIPAKIIGKDSSNWFKSFLINKGANDGIAINRAVLSTEGVLGKITEVYSNSAKVMILTNKDSKIGAKILETNNSGILQGVNSQYCIMNYLPRDSKIYEGYKVVTSGFNSIFPKGIILGEVVNINYEEFNLYQFAKVIPSVSLNKVEEVLVVVNSQE